MAISWQQNSSMWSYNFCTMLFFFNFHQLYAFMLQQSQRRSGAHPAPPVSIGPKFSKLHEASWNFLQNFILTPPPLPLRGFTPPPHPYRISWIRFWVVHALRIKRASMMNSEQGVANVWMTDASVWLKQAYFVNTSISFNEQWKHILKFLILFFWKRERRCVQFLINYCVWISVGPVSLNKYLLGLWYSKVQLDTLP